MAGDFDLDSYLTRIGYSGDRKPTLETLRGMHFAQATAIPFENLDVLAKRGIALDPAAVRAKLIDRGRGGYCFELNALYSAALRALGFQVTELIGRVRWMAPAEAATPRSHMLLLVALPEGEFLTDTGFGGLTLTGPLRFETDIEQETPHEVHRIVASDIGFELQAKLGETWTSIYRFSLEPQHAPDYELSNWYMSTHPESIFVNHLIAGRPAPDRRYSLLNNNFTPRHRDGRVETRTLETIGEMAGVLREDFRIALTDEDIEAALAPHFDRWRDGASG